MMTIWVLRNGAMVVKGSEEDIRVTPVSSSDFPMPRISRIAPYESPIDGSEITSWGQRNRELRAHDCFDLRDLPDGHVYEKSKGRKIP